MDTDLNKYYIDMIFSLMNQKICPLCFEEIKDISKICKNHFNLMTFMSDIRLCIKDKYYMDFVLHGSYIKLIVKMEKYIPYREYDLLNLVDKQYEFKELIHILNNKIDKLITFE